MRRVDQLMGYPNSHRRPGVIVMLHVGRCGSTVLANLLEQNPWIHWDGKLHRKARMLYGDKVRDLDALRWTKRQFAISGARYYGFEFKILEDQYPAILGIATRDFLLKCKAIGVTHYILLNRQNTLRHVVSHYASKNRGAWHSTKTDGVKRRVFSLALNDITTGSAPGRPLIKYLQEVDHIHEEVRAILRKERFIELTYETDINAEGAEIAYGKICNFLEVEPTKVSVRNVKMNPFPLEETVSNYGEVITALQGSKFEWMTTE